MRSRGTRRGGGALSRRARMLGDLRRLGWTIREVEGQGTSFVFPPARVVVLRGAGRASETVDTAVLAHETCPVLQTGGSRVLWLLRYLVDPWYRRRVEEEAAAHQIAVFLAAGVAWAWGHSWVFGRRYLLRRDLRTAERISARAATIAEQGARMRLESTCPPLDAECVFRDGAAAFAWVEAAPEGAHLYVRGNRSIRWTREAQGWARRTRGGGVLRVKGPVLAGMWASLCWGPSPTHQYAICESSR